MFRNKTAVITGASRGIGKEIALSLAREGANIVVAAKTAETHSKLPGTIYTAAKEIEEARGRALPCIVDVRDEKSVDAAVAKFGGIDILINNASAISLTGTLETEMKRYDLMHSVNTRGTFLMFTGNFAIDEDILREEGVTDFSKYQSDPSDSLLLPDFFVEWEKYDTFKAQGAIKNNLFSKI